MAQYFSSKGCSRQEFISNYEEKYLFAEPNTSNGMAPLLDKC